MKKNELFFNSSDNMTNVHMVIWEPVGEVKAVLEVVHGVTEHIMRYEELAKFLNDKGIAVVGMDLLGHGLSITAEKNMYFGEEGSWKYVVDDIKYCLEYVKDLYQDVPTILLGFSLGSFLVRTFLIDYPKMVDGAILVGTGLVSNFMISVGLRVVRKETKKYGEKGVSEKINKLTFDKYNEYFKPNRTKYDWLCKSTATLDDYINDTLSGEAMSIGLFREILFGMKYTSDKKNIIKMNKEQPILLLSGDKDAIGDFGKGVNKIYQLFKSNEIKDVEIKLYEDLRHDILHEDNRMEVYEKINDWIEKKILNK